MNPFLTIRPSMKLPLLYTGVFLFLLTIKALVLGDSEMFVSIWRGGVLAGFIVLGYIYLQHLTTVYSIDDNELTESRGIIARKVVRIPISRITNFQMEQNVTQRLLHLGDLKVDTPGNVSFEIKMSDLDTSNLTNVSRHLSRLLSERELIVK